MKIKIIRHILKAVAAYNDAVDHLDAAAPQIIKKFKDGSTSASTAANQPALENLQRTGRMMGLLKDELDSAKRGLARLVDPITSEELFNLTSDVDNWYSSLEWALRLREGDINGVDRGRAILHLACTTRPGRRPSCLRARRPD